MPENNSGFENHARLILDGIYGMRGEHSTNEVAALCEHLRRTYDEGYTAGWQSATDGAPRRVTTTFEADDDGDVFETIRNEQGEVVLRKHVGRRAYA